MVMERKIKATKERSMKTKRKQQQRDVMAIISDNDLLAKPVIYRCERSSSVSVIKHHQKGMSGIKHWIHRRVAV